MRDMLKLYEQHALQVYKYLLSLSADAALAEELTQETFAQALKSIRRYRGESKPEVWLCAIAKHLWYQELRRRSHLSPLGLEELAVAGESENPETIVLQQLQRQQLYQQLAALDAETQEVMKLRLAGELSFREIGDLLGKTENWARVRFYRGKQELSIRLQQTKEEPGDGR